MMMLEALSLWYGLPLHGQLVLDGSVWLEEIVHLLAGGSASDSDRAGVSKSRRKARSIAQQALTGALDPILAARKLKALRFDVDIPEDDPDFTCFVAIDSETDSLPLGLEREQWSSEGLARLSGQIEGARAWANTYGRPSFENVVRRFGGAGWRR